MRTFVSLNLPIEAQKEMAKLQKELSRKHWPVRWEKPEKIHLTLAFLGEVATEKLPLLQAAVEESVAKAKPFRVSFKGLGAFPDFIRPRIVWLGLKGDLQSLAALHKNISQALKKANLHFDQKPFVPHLTIGRVKKGMSKGALADLGKKIRQQRKINFQSQIRVDAVFIIQSQLQPTGSVYTQIAKLEL